MERTSSFSRRAAIAAFITLLTAALFWLIDYAASFFFLLFGGVTFAVVISAMAHFIQDKTPLSYSPSVSIVLLLLVALIEDTIWVLVPTVSQPANDLAKSLPQSVSQLKATLQSSEWGKKLLEGIPESGRARRVALLGQTGQGSSLGNNGYFFGYAENK